MKYVAAALTLGAAVACLVRVRRDPGLAVITYSDDSLSSVLVSRIDLVPAHAR